MPQNKIELDDALLEAMREDLEKVVIKEVCESFNVEKKADTVLRKEITLECI